jgi:hypothetical protein
MSIFKIWGTEVQEEHLGDLGITIVGDDYNGITWLFDAFFARVFCDGDTTPRGAAGYVCYNLAQAKDMLKDKKIP